MLARLARNPWTGLESVKQLYAVADENVRTLCASKEFSNPEISILTKLRVYVTSYTWFIYREKNDTDRGKIPDQSFDNFFSRTRSVKKKLLFSGDRTLKIQHFSEVTESYKDNCTS